jgi:hypothetical protein
VEREAADLRDRPTQFPGDAILQFGILCCAVAMVIVLAVAAAAAT